MRVLPDAPLVAPGAPMEMPPEPGPKQWGELSMLPEPEKSPSACQL